MTNNMTSDKRAFPVASGSGLLLPGWTEYLERKQREAATCSHEWQADLNDPLYPYFGGTCKKCGISKNGFLGRGPLGSKHPNIAGQTRPERSEGRCL